MINGTKCYRNMEEEGSGNLGQKGRVMKYVAFNQDLKG